MRTEALLREHVAFERWVSSRVGASSRVGELQVTRNDDLPLVYDCNLAWVELPDAPLGELEASWDRAFSGSPVAHRYFVFEDAAAAHRRQGEFAAAGYVPGAACAMLQVGDAFAVTNHEVVVRPVPADHPDFTAVRRKVWENAGYPAAVSAQVLREETLEATRTGCACYVGYLRGEPAGTIGLHTRGAHGYIDFVGTVPEHRNKGVGVTLLAAMGEASKVARHRFLGLTVEHGNPARRLYERLHYEVLGEIRTFLRSGPTTSRSNMPK